MPAHEGDAFHGLNSLTIFIASALNCFRRFKMPGMFVNSEHTNERWRRQWTSTKSPNRSGCISTSARLMSFNLVIDRFLRRCHGR